MAEKRKTTAQLRKEYEAMAAKCTQIAALRKKFEPELMKKVEQELSCMDLDLKGAIAQKRQAWIAWETANKAEDLRPAPGTISISGEANSQATSKAEA